MPILMDGNMDDIKTVQKIEYLPVMMKGFSWIAMILSPWAFLAFFANAIGILSLSLPELIFIFTIFTGVIPQFFSIMQRSK